MSTTIDGQRKGEAPSSFLLDPRKRRWVEGGLIFAFWTLMAVLMVGSDLLDARRAEVRPRLIHFVFMRSYIWALLTPLIFWVGQRFSLEAGNWRSHAALHLGLAVAVGVFMDMVGDGLVIYYVQPSWAEGRSLDPLGEFFQLDFLYEFTIYLAVLTAGFARDYFLRYQERRERASHLEAQLTQARLEALRMQINPHFLFNTLHAISTIVERDPAGVRRIITRLSELLRYTLEDTGAQEVPLKEELRFLDGYLDIQRIRFQEQLQVEKHIAPETLDALVPTLILQPLVENAVKHGTSRAEGPGHLTIRAEQDKGVLRLRVEDNGPGLSDGDPLEMGLGLRNTQERLQGLYGEAAALTLQSEVGGGFIAEITLPYYTSDDLRATSPDEEKSPSYA